MAPAPEPPPSPRTKREAREQLAKAAASKSGARTSSEQPKPAVNVKKGDAKSFDHDTPDLDDDKAPPQKRIAEILRAIHQHHIIHKDINPSNIVWNPETYEVKIIDFGIASVLPREQPEVRHPNMLEGTLAYMSP